MNIDQKVNTFFKYFKNLHTSTVLNSNQLYSEMEQRCHTMARLYNILKTKMKSQICLIWLEEKPKVS